MTAGGRGRPATWLRRFPGTTSVPLAAAAVYLATGWSRRWTSDDGFITLRVVQNLGAGHGPVFNAGERVEVSTSTVWAYLLFVLHLVTRAPLPWLAAVTGLLLGAAGVALVCRSAQRLTGGAAPVGVLVVLAVPAYWDFATAGLEGGLVLAWEAAALACVVAHSTAGPRAPSVLEVTPGVEPASTEELPCSGAGDRTATYLGRRVHRALGRGRAWARATPVQAGLLGLGPLVRPDLAPVTLVLGAAWWWLVRPRAVRTLAAALTLPVAYEVFRMAYYGLLVPMPALAKEASLARWGQGGEYLRDLVVTYQLEVPLALMAVLTYSVARGADRRRRVAVLAAPLAAAVQGLYVIRVGGDFTHARLLLPSVFLLLAPVAVVRLPVVRLGPVPLGVAAAWAVVCAVSFRTPYCGQIGPAGIADERAFYVRTSGNAHPVTAADYVADPVSVRARRLLALAQAPGTAAVAQVGGDGVDTVAGLRTAPVVGVLNIGIAGQVLGLGTVVVDEHGLADPVGGRLRLTERGRPGHEKTLPFASLVAEHVDHDVCDPLVAHVTAAWSPEVAWQSFLGAPAATGTRFPATAAPGC